MIDLLSHLQNVKKIGDGQYTAKCPAHEDRENSLSINITDADINTHCFAGCTRTAILTALGVEERDLHSNQDTRKKETSRHIYEYHDAAGELLYHKTRINYSDGTKSFFFTQSDGTKGVKGVQRVPYNLPAIAKARIVYFVEGEKCADAIIKSGGVATTLDGGAGSSWRPEYAAAFVGKTVIIIPDNDEPGTKYATMLKKSIPGAKIVTLPGLKAKEDIFDWLNTGHTLDEIGTLPAWEPPQKATTEAEPTAKSKSMVIPIWARGICSPTPIKGKSVTYHNKMHGT